MPLKSRLSRAPTPVAAEPSASLGTKVDEGVSPRRRTIGPTAPKAEEPDEVDKAVQALGDAVADVGDAFDRSRQETEEDDQTPPFDTGAAKPAMNPEPNPLTPVRKARVARARPALPEGAEDSTDLATLQALLSNIANDVKVARKEYELKVKPLVEQYKAVSARIADLLPGRI